MAKRKTKKEIHQPDDKLFKVVMEKKESAAQYLKTYYPELAKKVDLRTLKINREKFSIPNLKVFDADISYSCQFRNSKEKLNLSFIWENKSEPEEFVAIQIGLYLFLRYYEMVKKKGQQLEPIIPLIFYNGKKDWTPKTVNELFEKHPFIDAFKMFLPNFDFHFTNITKVPQEELLRIEMAFFKSAMVAMASRHNYDLLVQNFSVIFDIDNDDQISIGHYVFGIFERSSEEIQKQILTLPEKIQINIMSTLSILREEGREEGRLEEREALLKKQILRLNKKGFSIDEISDLLDIDIKFINKVLKEKKK